jgi:hypothetical protein
VTPTPGCSANFFNTTGANASAASARSTSVVMARTLGVLNGETPAEADAKYPGPTTTSKSTVGSPTAAGENSGGSLTAQPVGGASGGTTYYTPSDEGSGATGALLNYLLGN